MSRPSSLSQTLKDLLSELSGQEASSFPEGVTFLELGFDSLVLTQLAMAATKKFNVPIKLRDLLDQHSTIGAMVAHLDATMPSGTVEELPPPKPAVGASLDNAAIARSPSTAAILPSTTRPAFTQMAPQINGNAAAGDAVTELIRCQLALMAQQIELLAAAGGVPQGAPCPVSTPLQSSTPADPVLAATAPTTPPASTTAAPATPTRHGPQLMIEKKSTTSLSPTQERHLAKLFARYGARTAKSKAFTQRNRAVVADPRVPAGFKPALKEIVYPIVAERSSGCRLWDLDGNEYIDLLNGYGSNFFGYGAPFVKEAIREQLEIGMEIGPQTPLVEEVSSLFRQMVPGADRLAFCNTGSEAVLATLRLARTVTGRDKVLMFQGGYHGIFDEVVARGLPGGNSLPAAPGIPREATKNLLILEHGVDSTLEWLRANAGDLAAVLVEPVQSRRPDFQPIEFLREVRAITEKHGTVLIFDEVVTGFRAAPNGVQGMFGIRADLATYGKVIGGGLSIGVLAGKREYMDALDGGSWDFGDHSIPEVGVTYFAGTFVRHPIHLAATRAVLHKLIAEGPGFQERVNTNTATLADELNSLFTRTGAPLAMKHFCSVVKIATTSPIALGEIVFAHLRERGIHIWDGRPCYFTAAHSQTEIDAIVTAFRGAIQDMQEGGFYPMKAQVESMSSPPVPEAKLGRDPSGKPAWFVPDPSSPGRYTQVGVAK